MEILAQIAVVLTLLIVGYLKGTRAEKKHLRNIRWREKRLVHLVQLTDGQYHKGEWQDCKLVIGQVVIAQDYFKRFLAGLRNIFGGRLSSYETLMDRARREALLKMKEQAHHFGAKAIVRVRLETSNISNTNYGKEKHSGAMEVMAYGTAVK